MRAGRRLTLLPSLLAMGALCCQPDPGSEVTGSSPYLIYEKTPQGAEIVLDPERRPRRFQEAPVLARLVAQGELPPVEERLPENPLVLHPIHSIGRYGGTLRSGMIAKGLNEEMNRIMGMEKFLFYDASGTRIVPSVAEDWNQSEDGRWIRIHLRRGMRWSDGHPFTSEDVRFYWEDLHAHPDVFPFPDPDLVVNGKGMRFQVLDRHTVRFGFDDPYPRLLEVMASAFSRFGGGVFGEFLWGPYAPAHHLKQFHPRYVSRQDLDRKVRESQQEDWVGLMKLRNNYALNTELPVLMPWMTVQARDTSAWVLERNPYFWEVDTEGNQLPYIDRWVLTKATDREVINLRAIAGEYDFLYRYLDLQNLPVFLQHAEEENYNVYLNPSPSGMLFGCYFNLGWEGDPEISRLIQDANFRRALSLGLRRSQFSDAFYFSLATPGAPGPSPAHPEHPGERYRTLWSTYDPDRANVMLDDLGLERRDEEGYRMRSDGRGRLRIEIPAPSDRMEVLKFQMLEQQLEDLGIAVDVPILGRTLWWEEMRANRAQITCWTHPTQSIWGSQALYVLPVSRMSPIGPLFGLWFSSNGRLGKKPTDPQILRAQELYRLGRTRTARERTRIGREIWGIAIREQWMMSTVGRAPSSVRISDRRLGNVPAGLCTQDDCRTPSTGRLETLYWKQ